MNNRTKVTSIILLILLVGAGFSYWYTENTPDALYRKGIKYHNTNQAKAIKYYEKAAKKDHYRAQNNLAVLYIESQNSQNLPKARHLLEKMLQKNNKDTQVLFHLGNLLSEENYLGYDPEGSFYYYKEAADLGHAAAQHNTAHNFEEGFGITANFNEAMIYYKKASDQGFANSSFNLSLAYLKNKNIPRDIDKGKQYAKKACDQGQSQGCKLLKDLEEADRTYGLK